MIFDFPTITHIDPLLDLIKGRKEFIHAERDWYSIIQYVVMSEDTFPAITSNTIFEKWDEYILLRECRGIAFDKDGNLLHRPPHKFFNLNERHETQAYKIDFNKPHHILTKYDGSMVRPLYNKSTGEYHMATKMGVTDTALGAQEYVKRNQRYLSFFQYCREMGLSSTFEWCSKNNRIVLYYPEDLLVLLALRWNETGGYVPIDKMEKIAGNFDIPTAKSYGSVEDINCFVGSLNDGQYKGMEGFVIRFDDGHMIKVKTDEYLIAHRSKDHVSSIRKIVELFLDEKLDDMKPHLIPEDLEIVRKVEREVVSVLGSISSEMETAYKKYGRMDRKNFAVNVVKTLPSYIGKAVFSMMDGKDPMELAKVYLRSNVQTETLFRQFRNKTSYFGGF